MVLSLIGGLLTVLLGAEILIRGASKLALRLRISELLIGLTVVAFGTSAPELAVSLQAVFQGHPEIAIGTNIGSTLFNILFILGACATLAPLVISDRLIRLDVPIMLGAHLLLLAFCYTGYLTRVEGGLLLACLVAYIVFVLKKEPPLPSESEPQTIPYGIFLELFFIGGGLLLLVYGSEWILDGAVRVAQAFDVSDLVISITLIAAGTSLPEVATSIVATIRGDRDIAVGNVVGSCIFNALGIIGASALLAPEAIPVPDAVTNFDLPVAIAACFACLPIFFTGARISRWEGKLFLGYYIAYTAYLLLDAKQHDALPLYSAIMLWFVLPLTAVTLGVITYRSMKTN